MPTRPKRQRSTVAVQTEPVQEHVTEENTHASARSSTKDSHVSASVKKDPDTPIADAKKVEKRAATLNSRSRHETLSEEQPAVNDDRRKPESPTDLVQRQPKAEKPARAQHESKGDRNDANDDGETFVAPKQSAPRVPTKTQAHAIASDSKAPVANKKSEADYTAAQYSPKVTDGQKKQVSPKQPSQPNLAASPRKIPTESKTMALNPIEDEKIAFQERPMKPKKPTIPLDVGSLAAPRPEPKQAMTPSRKDDVAWPMLPDSAAPRMHFDKQRKRSLAEHQPAAFSDDANEEEMLGATRTLTEGQGGRPQGELITLGEKKRFRIVGDPVIDAMEMRVKERKEKERIRKEKASRRMAEQRAAEELRNQHEEAEKARLLAAEQERKRFEVEQNREKIRLLEEERLNRLNKGHLKADMNVIKGGSKNMLLKYEAARRKDEEEAAAALQAHLAAAKEASRNRRGSKLKRDIMDHEKAVMERDRAEAEQRRLKEHDARERQKARHEELESTLIAAAASSNVTAALAHTGGADDLSGLSKALVKVRKEEEQRKKAAAEPKLTPRTVSVSPALPFKTKPFVPPQKQSTSPQKSITTPVSPVESAQATTTVAMVPKSQKEGGNLASPTEKGKAVAVAAAKVEVPPPIKSSTTEPAKPNENRPKRVAAPVSPRAKQSQPSTSGKKKPPAPSTEVTAPPQVVSAPTAQVTQPPKLSPVKVSPTPKVSHPPKPAPKANSPKEPRDHSTEQRQASHSSEYDSRDAQWLVEEQQRKESVAKSTAVNEEHNEEEEEIRAAHEADEIEKGIKGDLDEDSDKPEM